MATKASSILLEVKRRLGDVNAVVPEETDALAYLNSALRGIWNYAIEIDSPRIETTETKTCDATGFVSLSKNPVKVTKVIDIDNNLSLQEFSPRIASGVDSGYGGMWGYSPTLDGIHLYMHPDCTGGNLRITYYPEFEELDARTDTLPFASSIDNIVIAWTVRLITDGRNMSLTDLINVADPVSSLIKYFEGHAEEHYVGNCPW